MQSVECDHDDGAGETIHRVFPLSEVLLLQCPGQDVQFVWDTKIQYLCTKVMWTVIGHKCKICQLVKFPRSP